jgi:hypothetical protein
MRKMAILQGILQLYLVPNECYWLEISPKIWELNVYKSYALQKDLSYAQNVGRLGCQTFF